MTDTAPAWNRFAHWSRFPARLMLFALALVMAIAAFTPPPHSRTGDPSDVPSFIADERGERPRDDDLQLYDAAVERIRGGEHYYDFIAEEHRKMPFPLKPGLAVRLPTLAYISAWIGETGLTICAFALIGLVTWAWYRRFTDEPGGKRHRLLVAALVFMGASLGLNVYYFALHELWAGMLVLLGLGLHRPGRWKAALLVIALALFIRETVLPVVLLLGAMAFWRRDWREGAAWTALAVAFAIVLAIHLHIVAGLAQPEDPQGPAWLVLRGLQGWIGNIVLSTNLRFLPHVLAGPVVFLMILGWAGWKTPAGATITFLTLGYGLAFMIAGRHENFYWGMIVAPAMFAGLALAPTAIRSLWKSAFARAAA